MKFSLRRHVVRLGDIFSQVAAGTAVTKWSKAEPASSYSGRHCVVNESAGYQAVRGARIRET
jgi:hypothetical protein